MTGTIANTMLLALSSAPLSGVVYIEKNPGGSNVMGMVLTNSDLVAAGGFGRSIAVTVSKQAAGAIASSLLWSGTVTPGQPVTIGGAVLAAGDQLIATASLGGVVGIELDGAVNADPVSQQLMGQNILLGELVGDGIPGPGATAAGVNP